MMYNSNSTNNVVFTVTSYTICYFFAGSVMVGWYRLDVDLTFSKLQRANSASAFVTCVYDVAMKRLWTYFFVTIVVLLHLLLKLVLISSVMYVQFYPLVPCNNLWIWCLKYSHILYKYTEHIIVWLLCRARNWLHLSDSVICDKMKEFSMHILTLWKKFLAGEGNVFQPKIFLHRDPPPLKINFNLLLAMSFV